MLVPGLGWWIYGGTGGASNLKTFILQTANPSATWLEGLSLGVENEGMCLVQVRNCSWNISFIFTFFEWSKN